MEIDSGRAHVCLDGSVLFADTSWDHTGHSGRANSAALVTPGTSRTLAVYEVSGWVSLSRADAERQITEDRKVQANMTWNKIPLPADVIHRQQEIERVAA